MSDKKIGEAYVYSAEKRRFDLFVASSLLPIELGFRAIARTQVPAERSVLLLQSRMGRDGTVFNLRKTRTLDDDGAPFSSVMAKFRNNGIDELPQLVNILRGDMSVVGRRPLLTEEFERQYEVVGSDKSGAKIVDEHKRTAGLAKPGLLSTHAIQAHRGDESVASLASRLQLDIEDFHHASADHTAKLVRSILQSVQHGELQHGSIQISFSGLESPDAQS